MKPTRPEVLKDILEVQAILHGAGTVSREALSAIARHTSIRSRIRRSVETGCGATTLLLSHLSEHHTAFALDIGGSIVNVRRSPLLREGVVSFVEGPSQRTLPQHHFDEKLQLAVIDGPHAYPFPDLEYYCLYPHLETGALLVLDDIHIRSINNLFKFLCSDEMFRLDEVVKTTAFFTRTEAPTFDPIGDGWRQQRYNARTLLRYDWRSTLGGILPRRVLRRLAAYRHAKEQGRPKSIVQIISPRHGEHVGHAGVVRGRAALDTGVYLWVLAHRKDVSGWWPQGGGPVGVTDDSWSVQVNYGGPQDAGCQFEVAALAVKQVVHERWMEWIQNVKNTGLFPPVPLPTAPHVIAESFVTIYKNADGPSMNHGDLGRI
ncbi:MAG TPA: class I SAM-dependent methyltransferase [Bryobacteraceae bacterium]|nr:class I SAM-dependent methyltransferase [Bryobacteraceae bacterium]